MAQLKDLIVNGATRLLNDLNVSGSIKQNSEQVVTKVNNTAPDASGHLTISIPDISGLVPTSRTINGKALTGNISLTASDVGAAASSHTQAASTITGLATVATSGSYNDLSNKPTIPTVNNATLTINQNNTSKGTFTANSSTNTTINLTDTTYESKTAASGGTAVSLVTTGEKYTWNNKGSGNVTGSSLTANQVVVGNGGSAIKNSGYTIATSVPSGAVFTDTYPQSFTWTPGTTTGPTLNLTASGKANITATLPTASTGAAGVVTTGAQTFGGVKTFGDGSSGGVKLYDSTVSIDDTALVALYAQLGL